MSQPTEKVYFSPESLKRLIASEGKEVKAILCYLWQNSINKDDVVELIDVFEILFTDNYRLSLCSNANNDGLEAINYDYVAEKKEIEKEHSDRIKVYGVVASGTKMWEDVIGKKLNTVQLTKQDGNYLCDAVVFNFGEERRIVSISPLDGLIIDFYEED